MSQPSCNDRRTVHHLLYQSTVMGPNIIVATYSNINTSNSYLSKNSLGVGGSQRNYTTTDQELLSYC